MVELMVESAGKQSSLAGIFNSDVVSLNTALIILITKAIGSSITPTHQLLIQGIQQHILGSKLHNYVVDTTQYSRETVYRNNVSTLAGDYLLAGMFRSLSHSRHIPSMQLIAEATALYAEGHYLPVVDLESWKTRTFCLEGAMDAYSLKAAVRVTNEDWRLHESAFGFGKNFAFLRKIRQEILDFNEETASPTSLPVILGLNDVQNIPSEVLYEKSIEKNGLQLTHKLLLEYERATLEHLSRFASCQERVTLENLVHAYGAV